MKYLVRTENLSKRYRENLAVDSIEINIKQGSIYGLIGKNGAGKTTLLKLIGGLTKPTNGNVSFFSSEEGNKIERWEGPKIGTFIENPGLYPNLTAFDNIKAKHLFLGKKATRKEVDDLLVLVGLGNSMRKKVKQFSLGMKQRLGLALSLVGCPELLILDEPINGLDPQGIIEVRNLLIKLNIEEDITIILSSHILDELAKIATDIGIIHEGKLVLEKSTKEFLKASGDMDIDEYFIKIIEECDKNA